MRSLLYRSVSCLTLLDIPLPSFDLLSGFLNLVLSQVLCCRLVLNLRRQALSGDVHTSEQHVPSLGTIGNAPRPVTDTVNTVNIPLDRFGKGRQWSDAGSEENGVKVHVTIERDVDHEW